MGDVRVCCVCGVDLPVPVYKIGANDLCGACFVTAHVGTGTAAWYFQAQAAEGEVARLRKWLRRIGEAGDAPIVGMVQRALAGEPVPEEDES